MLYFGTNITAPADGLQPVAPAAVYAALRQPKPALRQLVDQLRIIKAMDKNSYRLQKKKLPYLVCATFKPTIRRRENFLSISYFMVDLDGLSAHFDKDVLRQRLTTDPQVVLLFASPGGDGLKLLFRLTQKCTDYGLFSIFYKLFVAELARTYGLEAVVDTTTSDVTRACFLSYDEEAWYNEGADPVSMENYLNVTEPDTLWEAKAEADATLAELTAGQHKKETLEKNPGPAADVIAAIRQKLNPRYQPAPKSYYVPPEVDDFLQRAGNLFPAYGLQVMEHSPIQYGRKLKIAAGGLWAEINLFYGKRGYSFVKTTKTGSNAELADVCVQVLQQLIEETLSSHESTR